MLKKIALMAISVAVAIPEKIDATYDNKAATVVAGVGALGTIIYWANRESNDSLIQQAQLLIQESKQVRIQADAYVSPNFDYSSSDLSLLQNSLVSFQQTLLELNKKLKTSYKTIYVRYNSYVAPWNWTNKMLEISNEIKSVIEMNKATDIKIQTLLGKVNYLHCLQKYQNIVAAMHKFMLTNKSFYENGNFAFIDSLQDLYNSSNMLKLQQKELNKLLSEYKELDTQLKQIVYSLNAHDRNNEIEINFTTFGLHVTTLLDTFNQHILFLNIYLKYKECIVSIDSEQTLLKEARKFISGSAYPLKDFISQLDFDTNHSKNLQKQTAYVQTIEYSLKTIRDTIISSRDYIIEMQAYEIYLEQKRQTEAAIRIARAEEERAHAAQRQARANQEAADAAYRQARAAEEQNRLQKEQNRLKEEQNRIERERNDLERRKQQNNNRW